MIDSPFELGVTIAAAVFGAISWIQTHRVARANSKAEAIQADSTSTRTEALAKTNAELAASFEKAAEAWKNQFEKKEAELKTYRDWVHEENKKSNVALLECTNKNAELLAKTDLQPLKDHMLDVAQVLTKLVVAVDKLIERLPVT